MTLSMRSTAAISAGPRSAKPRGNCGLRESGLLGLFISAEAQKALRHLFQHVAELLHDLVDLRLGDDQRRRYGECVAGDAHHQPLVVEGALHRLEAACAD